MAARNPIPIKQIKTHDRPHLDEFLGIWLLRKFGDKLYPGISDAEIILFDGDDSELKSHEEYLSSGTILVGIGNGPLNEHSDPMSGKKKNAKSSAMLVAKDIGVHTERELEQILRSVSYSDQNPVRDDLNLGRFTKAMYGWAEKNPQEIDSDKIFPWVFLGLEAKYQEQLAFWDCVDEFSKNARHVTIAGKIEDELLVSFIETSNEYVGSVSRLKKVGNHTDVLISRNPNNGNIFITCNRKKEISLKGAAYLIRSFEFAAENPGVNIKEIFGDLSVLSAEGEVLKWVLSYNNLMRGCLTRSRTLETAIPLRRIPWAVIKTVGSTKLDNEEIAKLVKELLE